MIPAAILVVFPLAMAWAIVSDLVSMTIANRLSALLVVTFLVVAPMTGMAWGTYGMHIAAAAAALAATFALFAAGVMGGGDAKLIAATAIWFGFDILLLKYLLIASVLGGGLTLLVLGYRHSGLVAAIGGRFRIFDMIGDSKNGIPYGIALGLAALYLFPESPLGAWAIANFPA